MQKTSTSGTVDYLYDPSGNVSLVLASGSMVRGEVFLGATHVATYVGNKTYFHHANWLDSESTRTDESGTKVQDCEWNAYGELKACGTNTNLFAFTPYGFAGYERDPETGLDHMQFRYYNPRIGRFMGPDLLSGDTSNPQSLNKFGYTGNAPTFLRDGSGLDWDCPNKITDLMEDQPWNRALYSPDDDCWGGGGGSGGGGWFDLTFGAQNSQINPGAWGDYQERLLFGYNYWNRPGYGNEQQQGEYRHNSIISTGYDPALGIYRGATEFSATSADGRTTIAFSVTNLTQAGLNGLVNNLVTWSSGTIPVNAYGPGQLAAAGAGSGTVVLNWAIGGGLVISTPVLVTAGVVIGVGAVAYFGYDYYLKQGEKKQVKDAARAAGISYEELSDAIHEYKRQHGRGPKDNLPYALLLKLALEVARANRGQ